MRTISIQDRRRTLMRRHHLAGDAADPDAVVSSLIALHATDPASVYLSVLARSRTAALHDVATAIYDQRRLVRWMAMRRTLFVVARDDVPMVHAAVGVGVGATLRRQLLSRLRRNGTSPPIDGDVERWLSGVESRVEQALARRECATGAQLADDEPALRTIIAAGSPSQRPQNLTTPLLTLMGAEGRIVRSGATGAWTSRQHRWEPVARWWPAGLPAIETAQAQRDLAVRWLQRFGPATLEDLRWWTGWNLTTTRRALEGLAIEEVDLQGAPGIDLARPDEPAEPRQREPIATLLPALDPTPMGYTRREWFLGVDRDRIFDRAGNIGPTVWCDGEIVGSWAVGADGEVRTGVLVDIGAEARDAIAQTASQLQARLRGATVTPAIRTPLERSLVDAARRTPTDETG